MFVRKKIGDAGIFGETLKKMGKNILILKLSYIFFHYFFVFKFHQKISASPIFESKCIFKYPT